MMKLRRLIAVSAAASLVLASQLVPVSPAFAAGGPACPEQSANNTAPQGLVQAAAQPVVFVHGWNGNGPSMQKTGTDLAQRMRSLGDEITPLYFDYQAANFHWAANPEIAACLAGYLHQVSDAHRAAGGNGKVLVVAHSMGGLAARFAANSSYADKPADDVLGGLVTLDTPHLGSPFGNQLVARSAEVLLGHHAQPIWPFPRAGTDGSICLAVHNRQAKLPIGCDVPPYLPTANVPMAQIAGNVSVSRTLFGFHLYDIDLGSDGVVPSPSSQGYVDSGPVDARPQSGSQVESRLERCNVDLDQIQAIAVVQGFISGGTKGAFANFAASMSSSVFNDSSALDQLLTGKQGLEALSLLLSANMAAQCSHLGIVTSGQALTDTAELLKSYIERLRADVLAPYVGTWQVYGKHLVVKSDFTGDMTVSNGNCQDVANPTCLSHLRLKFDLAGSHITATILSVDKPQPEWGYMVGNTAVLGPGPQKGVIRLVFRGSPETNPVLCVPNLNIDMCGQ